MSKTALKTFLSKFPDDTLSWAKATDEVREIAKAAKEYYNEFDKPKKKMEACDFRSFATPSRWNTKGKKYIFMVYDKMGTQSKKEFNEWLNRHFGIK